MTMHLCGPALSLNGKKKGKQKFRNAEEARRARELAADWDKLKSKWGVEAAPKKRRSSKTAEVLTYKLSAPAGRETPRLPSRGAADHSGSTAPVNKVYTGTKVLGIATMHKSNAVPVFAEEEAIEISRMRRG